MTRSTAPIARPVAKAYVKVTPRFVRTGVSNVFNNLNTVPHGRQRRAAGQDVARRATTPARFLMNSTLGLGGLFDPAIAAGTRRQRRGFRPDLRQVGRETRALSHAAVPRALHGPRHVLARGRPVHLPGLSYLEDDSTRSSSAASTCSTCAPTCSTSTRSSTAATTATRSSAMPGCSGASSRSRTATWTTSRWISKRELKDDPDADRRDPRARHRTRARRAGTASPAGANRRNSQSRGCRTDGTPASCRHCCCCIRTTTSWWRVATSPPANAWRSTAKASRCPRPSNSATSSRAAPLRRTRASSSTALPSAR